MKCTNDRKFIYEIDGQNKMKNDLIFETVYVKEVFQSMIDKCNEDIFWHSNNVSYFDYDALKKLIPSTFKNKKLISHDKKLYVLYLNNFSAINFFNFSLSLSEYLMMKTKFGYEQATFYSDFENENMKDIGIILMNSKIIKKGCSFDDTISHELIHFFQWATGRRIHNFLKQCTPLDEEDVHSIASIFPIERHNVEIFKQYIQDFNELEPLAHEVYYIIIDEFKNISRDDLKAILEAFEFRRNDKCKFKDFFMNFKENCLTYLNWNESSFGGLLKKEPIVKMIILAYLKSGFNTFKGHLLSFYDKEHTK